MQLFPYLNDLFIDLEPLCVYWFSERSDFLTALSGNDDVFIGAEHMCRANAFAHILRFGLMRKTCRGLLFWQLPWCATWHSKHSKRLATIFSHLTTTGNYLAAIWFISNENVSSIWIHLGNALPNGSFFDAVAENSTIFLREWKIWPKCQLQNLNLKSREAIQSVRGSAQSCNIYENNLSSTFLSNLTFRWVVLELCRKIRTTGTGCWRQKN